MIFPLPNPYNRIGVVRSILKAEPKDYSYPSGEYDYKTVLTTENVERAKEAATTFMEKIKEGRISERKLDKSARKVLEIAQIEVDYSSVDIDEYEEALRSGLVEPYDLSVKSDRILTAAYIARDITNGTATTLEGHTVG